MISLTIVVLNYLRLYNIFNNNIQDIILLSIRIDKKD